MRRYSPIALLLAMAFAVSAQTIYKQVDKDGKVTYTDKLPSKEQAAQKVDIDTERNVAKPLGSKPVQAKELADKQQKRRADTDAALEKSGSCCVTFMFFSDDRLRAIASSAVL